MMNLAIECYQRNLCYFLKDVDLAFDLKHAALSRRDYEKTCCR